VDDPHQPRAVLDVFLHLDANVGRTVSRRDDLDRQVGRAADVPLRQNSARQPLRGDVGDVGTAHALGVVRQPEHEPHVAHDDVAASPPLDVLGEPPVRLPRDLSVDPTRRHHLHDLAVHELAPHVALPHPPQVVGGEARLLRHLLLLLPLVHERNRRRHPPMKMIRSPASRGERRAGTRSCLTRRPRRACRHPHARPALTRRRLAAKLCA
jgi:hypothetical protein